MIFYVEKCRTDKIKKRIYVKELSVEPIKLYESELRDKFAENAKACFEDLVKRSGVSREENNATVAHYREYVEKTKEADKKLSGAKSLRTFVIVITVLAFIAAVVGVLLAVLAGMLLPGILMAVIGALLGVGMIILIALKLNKGLRDKKSILEQMRATADKYLGEAKNQMVPLNRLYSWEHTSELIAKTTDLFSVDRYPSYRVINAFHNVYGLNYGLADDAESINNVLVGMAAEHPFLTCDILKQSVGSKSYYGSLQVTWSEVVYDSQGNASTRTHTETLTASVIKPIPVYDITTMTFYGNEAAPELSFTHKPTYAHTLKPKELEKKIKQGQKEAQKVAKEAPKTGKSFTEMANSEFEALFGAFDRNNDLQFRMMFTPFAQRNMVELMKNANYCGDDFTYMKRGVISALITEHAQHWNIDTDSAKFMDYDIESSYNKFMSFQTDFFRNIYFELAPFLAIPLNLQQKPFVFDETEAMPRNFSEYMAESVANSFSDETFAHPDTDTKVIIKTRFAGKAGNTDVIEVNAYSFRGEPRVDYVSEIAGDGNYYNVPVPWVEYIPVSQKSYMAMRDIGISRADWYNAKNSDDINSYITGHADGGHYVIDKGILAFKLASSFGEGDDAAFDGLISHCTDEAR